MATAVSLPPVRAKTSRWREAGSRSRTDAQLQVHVEASARSLSVWIGLKASAAGYELTPVIEQVRQAVAQFHPRSGRLVCNGQTIFETANDDEELTWP